MKENKKIRMISLHHPNKICYNIFNKKKFVEYFPVLIVGMIVFYIFLRNFYEEVFVDFGFGFLLFCLWQ